MRRNWLRCSSERGSSDAMRKRRSGSDSWSRTQRCALASKPLRPSASASASRCHRLRLGLRHLRHLPRGHLGRLLRRSRSAPHLRHHRCRDLQPAGLRPNRTTSGMSAFSRRSLSTRRLASGCNSMAGRHRRATGPQSLPRSMGQSGIFITARGSIGLRATPGGRAGPFQTLIGLRIRGVLNTNGHGFRTPPQQLDRRAGGVRANVFGT